MDKEASILTVTFDLDYESDANVSSEAINATRAFERVIRVVVPVVFTLIAVIGFTGNLLVIVVVAINRQMRSTTNLLIICLATADLTFIVICVPFTAISYAIPIWPFGQTWCQIYQNVIHITAYVSVYTLVLMSFDRYLAVVHPISSMTLRTWSKTCVVVSVFYSLICILESFAMMDFGVVEYVFYGEFRSSCLYIRSDNGRRRFYGFFFAFAYVVPLGLVCLLYGLMIRKLLSRMPRPGGEGGGRGGSGSRSLAAKMRSNRRVTLMVVVVVVVFAVCWFPIQVILILQTMQLFQENAIAFVSVKIASNCLAYLNSCVNPFLYAFLSESFRKGFRGVLQCGDVSCCCCCCDSDRSVSLRPETMGLIEPKGTHTHTHKNTHTQTHTQTHSRRIESDDLKEFAKTRTTGDIDIMC